MDTVTDQSAREFGPRANHERRWGSKSRHRTNPIGQRHVVAIGPGPGSFD